MTAAQLRGDLHAELRRAICDIARAYSALPPAAQARVDVGATDSLEQEVDRAVIAGDRERATAAIRAWRTWWRDEFERANQRGWS